MGAEHVTSVDVGYHVANDANPPYNNYPYVAGTAHWHTNKGNTVDVPFKQLILQDEKILDEAIGEYVIGNYTPRTFGNPPNSITIDFCIPGDWDAPSNSFSPYTASLGHCAALFRAEDLVGAIVSIDIDADCYTFKRRPGVIVDSSFDNNVINKYYRQVSGGKKCRLGFTGDPYDDTSQFSNGYPLVSSILDCCLTQSCYKVLPDSVHEPSIKADTSNNFTTAHCDSTMQVYCNAEQNWTQDMCITWMGNRLENRSKAGLEIYRDNCSEEMTQDACDYFGTYAHHKFSGRYTEYADDALDYYCNHHPTEPNCQCYLGANYNQFAKNLEESLGPTVCWLAECTTNLNGEKWLTRDMIITRKDCQTINCIISIDQLNADEATRIKLYNYCTNKNETNMDITLLDSSAESSSYKKQTWGSQFNIFYLLLALFVMIAGIIIFYNKSLKSR